jgi:hypothetical protein
MSFTLRPSIWRSSVCALSTGHSSRSQSCRRGGWRGSSLGRSACPHRPPCTAKSMNSSALPRGGGAPAPRATTRLYGCAGETNRGAAQAAAPPPTDRSAPGGSVGCGSVSPRWSRPVGARGSTYSEGGCARTSTVRPLNGRPPHTPANPLDRAKLRTHGYARSNASREDSSQVATGSSVWTFASARLFLILPHWNSAPWFPTASC